MVDYSSEYWRERNAKRRTQYQHDPEYRRKQVQATRAAYRKANDVVMRDCRENLDALASIGDLRSVWNRKTQRWEPLLCFTCEEAAEALGGYAVQIMYRWQADGRLPKPVFIAKKREDTDATIMTYLSEEIEEIIKILGQHQAVSSYYLTVHTEVQETITAAVRAVRAEYGVNNL